MLLSPVLSKLVHTFYKDGHDSCYAHIDEVLYVLNSFFFVVLQTKLVLHLRMLTVMVDIIIIMPVCLHTFWTVLSGSRAISGTPASSISENRFRIKLADLQKSMDRHVPLP